jgi:DNA-binding response OmpR family regulator
MPRIVVVDDSPDICDLVRYRLTAMEMDVAAYPDGECGLEAIVADPPDLAIIDVIMPKMDGLALTRALRANATTRALPIILFSALGSPEIQVAGSDAGGRYYAIKPFNVTALGTYVKLILGLVTCAGCGKKRALDDPIHSPEQALQNGTMGWSVTTGGEFCGDCRDAATSRRA